MISKSKNTHSGSEHAVLPHCDASPFSPVGLTKVLEYNEREAIKSQQRDHVTHAEPLWEPPPLLARRRNSV